jgi:hypothetical protein
MYYTEMQLERFRLKYRAAAKKKVEHFDDFKYDVLEGDSWLLLLLECLVDVFEDDDGWPVPDDALREVMKEIELEVFGKEVWNDVPN